MDDLVFLAGDFLYGDLPQEKEYLQYYFKGMAEKAFVSYYFLFPKLYKRGKDFVSFYVNFSDHTGICCSDRWVSKLLVRLLKIEEALAKAEKEFDIVLIGNIKSGLVSFR
jgi:hypothetical protein